MALWCHTVFIAHLCENRKDSYTYRVKWSILLPSCTTLHDLKFIQGLMSFSPNLNSSPITDTRPHYLLSAITALSPTLVNCVFSLLWAPLRLISLHPSETKTRAQSHKPAVQLQKFNSLKKTLITILALMFSYCLGLADNLHVRGKYQLLVLKMATDRCYGRVTSVPLLR